MGHDRAGAELAREVLSRLRTSERLRSHVAALVRHHLRLGFLVHEPQPLARRTVYGYLTACAPVEVDVTLLSVADRLATRGRSSERAIDAHLRVAAGAARRRAALAGSRARRRRSCAATSSPPQLGIAPGPELGSVLEELAEARYAGEISSAEQAIEHARASLARS